MCSSMGFTNWKSRICRGCSHMCPEISGTAEAQMFSPGQPVGINLCLGFSFWPHGVCEELQESTRNIAALLASSSAGLSREKSNCGGGKRGQSPGSKLLRDILMGAEVEEGVATLSRTNLHKVDPGGVCITGWTNRG